ncbi:Outer membrane protein (porin) [Roseateles sp. YR242]|uniref:porin n=1 Tax=Roseateles sp. YR242 TaxID=1855305 RepID=UPI0008D15FAF|nr:porin [Roseateles sp. YR242]SEK56219.1 Outer membrane protein (porin) [Roseateles sp. YR242]
MKASQAALSCVLACASLSALAADPVQPYLYSHLARWPEFNPGNDNKVTMYGTVDLGLNYAKAENATASKTMQSGGDYTSKLGIYGREDLGGGLKAEFNLESSIKADTGTATTTQFWDRAAWVGLKSREWGTLRLGNQLGATLPLFVDVFGVVTTNSMSYWLASAITQKSAYTAGISSYGLNSDLGNGATQVTTRVPRAISYQTPRINGFDAKLMYAPGANTTSQNKVYNRAGVVTYLNGPWFGSASYNQVFGNNSITGAAVRTDVTGVAGIYDTGSLVLSAAVNQNEVKIQDGGKATVYSLGFILPAGRHVARVSMVYRDTSGVREQATGKEVSSSALGIMAGYDYELSKSVGLYARAGWLRNYGASTIMFNNVTLPLQAGTTNAQLGITAETAAVGMYYHF